MPNSLTADSPSELLALAQLLVDGDRFQELEELARAQTESSASFEVLPTDLTVQVQNFFLRFCFADRMASGPTGLDSLSQDEIRQRLKVLVDEFVEVMEVFGVGKKWAAHLYAAMGKAVDRRDLVKADLSRIAHELADLDFAAEGIRVMLGIPRKPVAVLVYQANMAKVKGEGYDPEKPDGWESPIMKIREFIAHEEEAHREPAG